MAAARSRGQHAGLTRPVVLAAAVRVVDEEGLAALSMRRLGAELGVEAMALYHHVGSKDELLDGLVEHLFAQILPPDPTPGQAWPDVVREVARRMLATLLAHPNLVPVLLSRPATTPQVHELLEQLLRALDQAGLPPGRALDLVYAVITFVLAHVATGGDAGDSTTARRRVLAAEDLRDFPLLARAAHEPPVAEATAPFEVTLEALLAWFDRPPVSPEG